MDRDKAKTMIRKLLAEIQDPLGRVDTDRFSGLRDVDAKVREFKLLLEGIDAIPPSLLQNLAKDPDFSANSRRVRLEALANYAKTAINFLDSGVFEPKKIVRPAPDLSRLTAIMPNLENAISSRWLEAQRCQQSDCFIAAIVLMGSILEGLLLARALMSPADAFRASSAPKDKDGKQRPIHDWSLNSLIDISVELGWIKTDRGKFGHALRESRNVIHPWQEIASRANFDEATCRTSWEVLTASVQDLLASVE
jgi:hypothetical protein